MTIAPAIFGHIGLAIDIVDPRWLAVKDERPGVRFKSYVRALPLPDKAQLIDRWVNRRTAYVADPGDSWAKPGETHARRSGDCEDFALFKRAVLIEQGAADEDILFVIVRDLIQRASHALLVVAGLVLDSFNSLSLPIGQVKDYRPIMAFSGPSAWLFGKRV